VGGSDRTGRTLFDIQERVPGSCLAASMALIIKASNSNSNSKQQAVHDPSVSIASSSLVSVSSDRDRQSHSLAGLNERVSHFKYSEMSQSHGYDGAAAEKKHWRTT
jgi:hypothetical protein